MKKVTKVMIGCTEALPQSAQLINSRFPAYILTLRELGEKSSEELRSYNYVVVVDDLDKIRHVKGQVNSSTFLVAIMTGATDFIKARQAGANVVFGPKGSNAASYITSREM